ncbi:unnamed protein product, partial [Coregonus sp. 'balchen']
MLRKIVRSASKVLGVKQTGLESIYDIRGFPKAHKEFELLPSGRRYRAPGYKINKDKQSFIPAA